MAGSNPHGLVAALPAGGTVQAAATGPVARALLDKARTMGSVRVIATLKAGADDLSTLSEAEMSAYAARLRKTQDAVIDRVLGGDRSGVTTFDITPAIVLSVTADQLQILLADPAVAKVQEDALAGPSTLQGSPTLVQPGQ
jgi:hypothetical protein